MVLTMTNINEDAKQLAEIEALIKGWTPYDCAHVCDEEGGQDAESYGSDDATRH